MPIITRLTNTGEVVRTDYTNCVLKVQEHKEVRNVSDTLDYSDYQTVTVQEALVYCGRSIERTFGAHDENSCGAYLATRQVQVDRRFQLHVVENE